MISWFFFVLKLLIEVFNHDCDAKQQHANNDQSSFAFHGVMSATIRCQTLTRASSTASLGSFLFCKPSTLEIHHNDFHDHVLDLTMVVLTRCKYLEHLNLSGLDEHSTPADYNDLLHSTEVMVMILTCSCHRWRSTTWTWSRTLWGSCPTSWTSTLAHWSTMAS